MAIFNFNKILILFISLSIYHIAYGYYLDIDYIDYILSINSAVVIIRPNINNLRDKLEIH